MKPPKTFRACTHKLRLFGNRSLMSALPPEADKKQTSRYAHFVPIADIDPPHSITLSARPSSASGILMPSTTAVLALTES